MNDIIGFLLSVALNTVAVILVWKTDDVRVDCGVILMQVFFLLYQIYRDVETE